MIATKEQKDRKDRIPSLCVLWRQRFERRALLNVAVWVGLLVGAGVLWPEEAGQAHGFSALKVFALLAWGVGAFALAGRRGCAAWVGWPVALAGFLALQYVQVTPPSVRQHDVGGHREYIDHLAKERSLPAVRQGWETWQPPLYYVAAAVWRWPFSAVPFADPFRPVQFSAAVLYLTVIVAGLLMLRRLGFNDLETVGTLGLLALLPGHVFFAARINNDVLLPFLGAGLLFVTAEFVKAASPVTGHSAPETRWLWWLAVLLPALLATKSSSLAVVGGALALVFFAEARRSGWQVALVRAYWTGLPAVLWQVFWWVRTAAQTGSPFYVNAALPDNLRVDAPAWRRLCSFDFAAFIGGGFYYDEPMRQSYPTALAASLLYGEYGMHGYAFRWPELLRWGCLGMLLVLAAGALVVPRAELRPVWNTCLVLVACQFAITMTYAVQFPFACNQNMRFFAPAFVPLCGLFGLGLAHFWERGGQLARGALAVMLTAFVLGLTDFYRCVLFGPSS